MQQIILNVHWLPAKDGDLRAKALYERHYSAYHYRDNRVRKLVCGPGEKMLLLTLDCDALFIWRKFRDASGQQGVNCAAFRNEGPVLSSILILEAEELAWGRWPGARLYTYVNDRKITSCNPGYCFKMAGWQLLRDEQGAPLRTKTRKLLIFEKLAPIATQKAKAA